jgi:hypothetical protein
MCIRDSVGSEMCIRDRGEPAGDAIVPAKSTGRAVDAAGGTGTADEEVL